MMLISACAPQSKFKASSVGLPENYRDEFLHYATIARADNTVRDLFISPNLLTSSRQSSIPDNTTIVIEAYYAQLDDAGNPLLDDNGQYLKGEAMEMIHVAEKRPDWRPGDFVSEARVGKWNFGSYGFESRQHFDEDLNACFNCHIATRGTDFIYSLPLLVAYLRSGQTQYFYCDLPDRIAC
jgi:hypothetical protein